MVRARHSTTVPGGNVSINARTGAMRLPAPINNAPGRCAWSAVNSPVGASIQTRAPGLRSFIAADWSPSAFTASRRASAFGLADNEYGCERHHPSRVRNRQCRYWPAVGGYSS